MTGITLVLIIITLRTKPSTMYDWERITLVLIIITLRTKPSTMYDWDNISVDNNYT